MKAKLLVCVAGLCILALSLLVLRQSRIVEVNQMNRVWRTLQHEQDAWRRLRLEIAAAARPEQLRPTESDDHWSAALDQTLHPVIP